mmetsp:Transcript_13174/g.25912  ORF Transcript_13174/g.25912 Transcript_13174/m.25912 type:complete len:115 (-) Transcript_13174:458-802(-)
MFLSDLDPVYGSTPYSTLIFLTTTDLRTGLVQCRSTPSRAGKDLLPFFNEWNLNYGAFKLLRSDNEKGILEGDVRTVLNRAGTVCRPFASNFSRGPTEKWWTVLRAGMISLVAT